MHLTVLQKNCTVMLKWEGEKGAGLSNLGGGVFFVCVPKVYFERETERKNTSKGGTEDPKRAVCCQQRA